MYKILKNQIKKCKKLKIWLNLNKFQKIYVFYQDLNRNINISLY